MTGSPCDTAFCVVYILDTAVKKTVNTRLKENSRLSAFKTIVYIERLFLERFGKDIVLLEKLASGGMAEVYRGKHLGFGGFEKTVAIKRILPSFANNDEFKEMFRQEANLSARNLSVFHDTPRPCPQKQASQEGRCLYQNVPKITSRYTLSS
jgi:hypothetical protein